MQNRQYAYNMLLAAFGKDASPVVPHALGAHLDQVLYMIGVRPDTPRQEPELVGIRTPFPAIDGQPLPTIHGVLHSALDGAE